MRKTRKVKKLLALVLAVVTCTTMLAACGGKQSDGKGDNGGTNNQGSNTDGGKEFSYLQFSYMRPVWGEATYKSDGAYEQALCEAANVDIDVQITPVADYDSKVVLMAGAGPNTMPDVMWAPGPSEDVWNEMEEQGAFVAIEDYLERYPAVKEAIPDSIWEDLRAEDGHIYFVPNLVSNDTTMMIFYRKDWFDELGIKEPTTIAELEDALEKIKKGKPDVIPLTQGNSGLQWAFRDVATCFGGVVSGWTPQADGKIVPMEVSKGYQDFVFWLQDMSKRGLLDAEAGLNGNLAFGEVKFRTGKAAVISNHLGSYLEAVVALKANDPKAEVGIMSPLTGPTGIQGGTRRVYPVDRGFYFNGKLDGEKVDRIFQFLEWTLTDGSDLAYWGIEGKTYKVLEDGTKVKIPDAEREDEYRTSQMEPLQFIVKPENNSYIASAKPEFEQAGYGDLYDYLVKKNAEYRKNEFYDYKSPYIVSPTYLDEGAVIGEAYLYPVTGSAILDKKITRAKYEDAVDTWLAMGGQKIIDETNKLQGDVSKPNY